MMALGSILGQGIFFINDNNIPGMDQEWTGNPEDS